MDAHEENERITKIFLYFNQNWIFFEENQKKNKYMIIRQNDFFIEKFCLQNA